MVSPGIGSPCAADRARGGATSSTAVEIAVAVGSERQWARFVEAIGSSELTDDPRFATNGDRVENREALRPLLAARLAAAPTADWIARLGAAEVPVGPINDVAAALASPQVAARGLVVDIEHPVLGTIRQVGPPFDLKVTPATVRTPPPLLGEHSDAVLTELGFDPSDIERLRDAGAV